MLPPSGAVRRSDKARVMMGSGFLPFFHSLDHLLQNGLAFIRGPQTARDPDVTLAVNGKSAGAKARLEGFDLSRTRIGRREPAQPIACGIADPNSILLVNREMERPQEMARVFFGVAGLVHKKQTPFGGISFGHENHGAVFQVDAQISPLGVAIIPCISPSLPPKL